MRSLRNSTFKTAILHGVLFVAIVSCAYSVRYYHFHSEEKKYPAFLPYTKESAMMYSFALAVAEGQNIPAHDKSLAELDSVGLEYFLGYGYRLKKLFAPPGKQNTDYEDNPDFTSWARLQMRLWISLTAGLVFLWLRRARCSIWSSVIGALVYAVTPAAVSRATGQDLIRELFAIPFITLFFLSYYRWLAHPRKIALVVSGISVFLALAFWDMTQLCLALWGLYEIIRLVSGAVINRKRKTFYVFIYLVAVSAAFLVPYLRTHCFIMSPAMSIILPLLIIFSFSCVSRLETGRRIVFSVLAALTIVGLWLFIVKFVSYGGNYSHFYALILAKVKFMNVKPANPALLDFDSRILWTPALHSATFRIVKYIFPVLPYFLLFLGMTHLYMYRKRYSRYLASAAFPIFMCIVFFILFVFMVRFHVLCIIFMCVAGTILFNSVYSGIRNGKLKIILAAAFIIVLLAEADISLRLVQQGGRSYEGDYPEETAALIKWFRQSDMKDKTVLAGFTVSPMLKGYCGTKIVLHPKFELSQTRTAVEKYLNIIYKGTEKDLSQFCKRYNVDFYLFDRGYNGPLHPYSSRYCADGENFDRTAPVYRFYHKNEKLKMRAFYEIEPPKELDILKSKFTLFKVISEQDFVDSLRYVSEANDALKKHNIMKACESAEKAVYKDPLSYKARILYVEIFGKAADIKLEKYKRLFK